MDALTALRAEADALAAGLGALAPGDEDRPTRCTPWRVRDVTGHVVTVLGRVPDMISAAAPQAPDTTATGYYRADDRFSTASNTDRVRTAQARAGSGDGRSLARELTAVVDTVVTAAARQPAGRLVRTRHGDAMTLGDFLTTRVVELAVHGLDIADAAGRPAWLTVPAAEHLDELLFGPAWRVAIAGLGWDRAVLLRRVTARAAVTVADRARLTEAGLRPLTLG